MPSTPPATPTIIGIILSLTCGICAFIGQESFAPGEASDDHLTGTATVSVQTVPKWIEDNYDVAVTEDDQGYPTAITLTKKS